MKPLHTLNQVVEQFELGPRRNEAFNYWNEGEKESLSSEEFIRLVKAAAVGLRSLGLNKGDRVGLYAPSSPWWTVIDLAIAVAGGVTVPFFNNLSLEHFIYEVDHAKPRWIFVGNDLNYATVGQYASRFEAIFALEREHLFPAQFELAELVKRGEEALKRDPMAYERLSRELKPEDLATIIYTSGSTGTPKGVELTHENLAHIINMPDFPWEPKTDRYLNILPLAHIFAKQLNLLMVAWAIEIHYLNDLTKIADTAKEVKPTFMIVVPRLLEKVYAKMAAKVESGHGLKRAIGRLGFQLANHPDMRFGSLLRPLLDLLVFKKLRAALGGKIRFMIAGGAPLDPKLHRFFIEVGYPIAQGWGMTEVSCCVVNRIEDNHVGTVGLPLGDTKIKIAADGELLVKGPTVMRGYYQNKEATKSAFDSQGWFHTGDRGHIEPNGQLVIEGRMNESFKTAQGEFVNPVPIEQLINKSPLIEMSLVVGEGKPFAAALLFPEKTNLKELKKIHAMELMSDQEFVETPLFGQMVERLIRKVNEEVDHWEQIHDWRVLSETPTIERGELTPTLKLRRKFLIERYKQKIGEMYQQEPL